jgi:hypothetical protein
MEDVKRMVIKNKMKPTTGITISLVVVLSLFLFVGVLPQMMSNITLI